MQGLTSQQVQTLLEQHGPNILPREKKKSTVLKLFEQINNVFVYLLIAAATLSFFVHEWIEAILILVIVILNALFGLYQEHKAEEAIAVLEKMSISTVRVVRDGKEQEIDSRNLVPGDIVILEEGEKVPADGELTEASALELNESILTGESLPVPKEKKEEVYMGTILARGHGVMKVTKTGINMRFGAITKHLLEVEKIKTPLQKKLEQLSRVIGIVGIIMSLVVFFLSITQGITTYVAFLLAISLAVAIVPEGLPAVMTVTLSIGVKEMAKRKALIRRLSAIEALGNITLIASDKTGTITSNKMRVKELYVGGNVLSIDKLEKIDTHLKLLLDNGILCSTASLVPIHDGGNFDVLGDPTEGSLLLAAQDLGISYEEVRKSSVILDEEPFDSTTKRMAVHVKQATHEYVFAKGSPESILSISKFVLGVKKDETLNQRKKDEIMKALDLWAGKGYRILAFAYRHVKNRSTEGIKADKPFIFLGMAAIYDPPRQEVKEALQKAYEAGVKVVMITGDNEKTAESIGTQVGLLKEGDEIMTGAQVEGYSDAELLEKLPKTRIFARTSPLHKSRIVKLFQHLGETVAVTGDGVNDAVALKQADVGIAMGMEGTDVARETADMVLSDDNFATIVNAIEAGRNIVQKLENTVKYLLTTNLTEAGALTIGMALGFPTIFFPLQILYINLISDGLPAIALAFSPTDPHLMKEKPAVKATLIDKPNFIFMMGVGLFGSLVVFGGFIYFLRLNDAFAKTAAFSVLAMTQSFVFAELWFSHRNVFKHLRFFRSQMFWVAFLSPFVLQFLIVKIGIISSLFRVLVIPLSYYFIFIALSSCVTIGIGIIKKLTKRQ